jgi:Flp pilus assembly protein TadG
MHELLQLVGRFRRDERGVFAVFFGLLAVVLVATAGAVVDFTTLQQARTRAQDALDSAALGLQPTIWDTGVTEATIGGSAQNLLEERLTNSDVTAEVTNVTINRTDGLLRIGASITVPMVFVQLVGVNQISASVVAEARSWSADLEVAVALDVTGSMGTVIPGSNPSKTRVQALKEAMAELIPLVVKDVQTPTYTKMALAPYSMGVNVGSYAGSVRSAATSYTSITGASWWTGTLKTITAGTWAVGGTARNISGITRANPARVTTSSDHGYSTGQVVFISGVSGMTQVNDRAYTITVTSSTQFTLGVNSSSYSSYSSSSNDTVTRCVEPDCAVTFTSSSHGFANTDLVGVTGVGGMTINGEAWTIKDRTTNTFELTSSVNGTVIGTKFGTYSSSGSVGKCTTNECELIVTSSSHGLANNEYVYITNSSLGTLTFLQNVDGNIEPWVNLDGSGSNNIAGMVWQVTDVTTNGYVLEDSMGPRMGTYASGGRSYCTRPGCQYQFFRNGVTSGTYYSLHQISTCVSERVGANQLTDVAPSTTPVGRNYPAPSNGCLTNQIVPLTSNKATLNSAVTALQAGGSTAGHVGIAWSWYLVSPNFGYLFPSGSQPAAYGTENLMKVAILMTDGEYNSSFCDGVISQDSTSGSGSIWDHKNCNATNGSSWSQAEAYCTAMKAAGVIVYTVGFEVINNQAAIDMMANCATDAEHAYLANGSQELKDVFRAIGKDIAKLRLSE